MLYKEIIAVCSEIHTKLINTLCVEFLFVKLRVAYIKTKSTLEQAMNTERGSRNIALVFL
jgi:hypothetical protein